MTLIEAIREAVTAAIDAVPMADVVYATYTGQGLRVDSALQDIPLDRVDIPPLLTEAGIEVECQSGEGISPPINGRLILKAPLAGGDKVAAAVHHDRQRFSVLYRLPM